MNLARLARSSATRSTRLDDQGSRYDGRETRTAGSMRPRHSKNARTPSMSSTTHHLHNPAGAGRGVRGGRRTHAPTSTARSRSVRTSVTPAAWTIAWEGLGGPARRAGADPAHHPRHRRPPALLLPWARAWRTATRPQFARQMPDDPTRPLSSAVIRYCETLTLSLPDVTPSDKMWLPARHHLAKASQPTNAARPAHHTQHMT